MKILAGLAAFAALAAPSAGAKSMTEPAKMEAAVHAYVAAFEAGSADDVAELYAMDATVEEPIGSPVHKGREAIRVDLGLSAVLATTEVHRHDVPGLGLVIVRPTAAQLG